ncbi:isoprenyl transferase [Pontibacter sp. G13]|uniref:isoprenyl transferase n=1 Tax=Pontibacter sp. G13 TaxID=3074898 RepID=UPI00288ACCEB|nr:isoprenyl transferase [Pontibacter sp. G13]WNJ16490.1 isoprenyl transferase [Pontibacter sp. G13]
MRRKEQIDPHKLPKHIAIIMDGNGRWAKSRGSERVFGHRNAITAVREAAEGCAEIGVEYLTLFAFSTENWRRPPTEVRALMTLLVETIGKEVKTLMDNGIRLRAIGNIEQLPARAQKRLAEAMETTKDNKRMTLTLALSYGARADMTQAIRDISKRIASGEISPDQIDEELVSQYLSTSYAPDPELLIRTSGEHRISNFLLWEIAYAEIFFMPKLWPDFRREDLHEAILNFQNRERRFGKISEQIQQ